MAPRAAAAGSQHAEGAVVATTTARVPGRGGRRAGGSLGDARSPHPSDCLAVLGTVAAPVPGTRPVDPANAELRVLACSWSLQTAPLGTTA
jgi:hypothetical protein